jgi:hypothetical protein
MAAVPELTASADSAATRSASRCSKRRVRGPVVSHSPRSVAATSSISSSPMDGGENGSSVVRRAGFLRGDGEPEHLTI